MGAEAKSAIPVLVTALKNVNDRIRSKAAFALGCIGKEVEEAIPALTTVLKGKNKYVHSNAVIALRKMNRNKIE